MIILTYKGFFFFFWIQSDKNTQSNRNLRVQIPQEYIDRNVKNHNNQHKLKGLHKYRCHIDK